MASSRQCTHAGTWYSANGAVLQRELDHWFATAVPGVVNDDSVRAVIAPHGGFAHSGATAAYAYKAISAASIRRIYLLGPSHHYMSDRCLLSGVELYESPLGAIRVDQEAIAALMATERFQEMDQEVDEAERSLEMQLPFIQAAMAGRDFSLVPILVGSISTKAEQLYGRIFAPLLADPENFFVISSDLCHWGSRFGFTRYDKALGPIHKFVEWMDRTGMASMQGQDPVQFAEYLQETENTICGRHAIAVLLEATTVLRESRAMLFDLEWVRYSQSVHCTSSRDSSVSYAAGLLRLSS